MLNLFFLELQPDSRKMLLYHFYFLYLRLADKEFPEGQVEYPVSRTMQMPPLHNSSAKFVLFVEV
jgi:hypothetical protein